MGIKFQMKIHFSNVNFGSRSGPNTFAFRLADGLKKRGHKIVDASDNYDVFLAFIEPASKPRPDCRLIQRLDGIWFKPEEFHTHNQNIKWAYDNAHEVIWQSEFDKGMTEHHWGERSGTVIHNGIEMLKSKSIDKTIFGDCEKLFVCSANWHPQKRLEDNIRVFRKILKTYPKSTLAIMGKFVVPELSRIAEKDPELASCFNSLRITGDLQHSQCLEIFATADWMIHTAWLDHCPNVVVESLSQNCPVICASEGGTKEIVGSNGIVIQGVPYNFELTDYDKPPRLDLDNFVLPYIIEVDSSHLDIEHVIDKYEKVLAGT